MIAKRRHTHVVGRGIYPGNRARIEIIQKLEAVGVPHVFYDQPSGMGAMPLDQRV
jgi:hypothetical protein